MGSDPQQLWRLAAAGDHAAFTTFYRASADIVFAHAKARLKHQADAEDVTGEVFAIAWRKRRSVRFHPRAGILPWLLTTTNNLIRKHYSVAARRARLNPQINDVAAPTDFVDELIGIDEEKLLQQCLQTSLSLLRPKDRQMIEFRFMHKMSHAQIGDLLGMPETTARSRVHRALARARRHFMELYEAAMPTPAMTRGGPP